MNVEIGAEAALFSEKEYISGIFVAVYLSVRKYVDWYEGRVSLLPPPPPFLQLAYVQICVVFR